MTQTLKLSEVKEFLSASRYIQNTKIIPVLDFILWRGNTLTKNNLLTFCTVQIESATTEPILLDEKSLQAISIAGTSDTIEITISDKVHLKCGKAKISHAIESPANFTVLPSIDRNNSHILTQDILGILRYASLFSHKGDNPGNLAHIHIIDGMLFSTNTFIFFITKCADDVPHAIFTPEMLPILTQIKSDCEYIPGERNDFFINGNITYSFTKTEDKTPSQPVGFHKIFSEPQQQFMIQRSEFSKFLDMALQINEDRDPMITMHQNGEGIALEFAGMNSKETETKIWCDGALAEEFTFNPELVAPLVKNYPYEVMNGKQVGSALVFQSDEMIIAIQKLQKLA